MSKVTWKAGTMLYPLPPVMVSCGTMEKSNIITVAWTGTVNSEPPMTYVSVRPERYSYGLIKETGEFVINLTTDRLVWNADFCGVKSGRDVDKFALPGLTAIAASEVSAPMIEESPVNIECRVRQITPLGSHNLILADVVAVTIDDAYMDEAGKFHLNDTGLITYSHGEYFLLGKKLGTFGYSVRKDSPVKKGNGTSVRKETPAKKGSPVKKGTPAKKDFLQNGNNKKKKMKTDINKIR